MERVSDEEVLVTEDESRRHLRRGVLHFSPGRDLPMIVAVRNATFISHGQPFSDLVSQGTESNRQGFCWRLKRLVDAGLIHKMPQIMPYSGATYTITRDGLSCLESCGEGLVSLTPIQNVAVRPSGSALSGAWRDQGCSEKNPYPAQVAFRH